MLEGERSRRVLVVEDDDCIRQLLALALGEDGFEVVTAAHGEDALTLIRSGYRPHVVLLDVDLPVMDGPSFVAAYRRLPGPHARIVLVSAAIGLHQIAVAVAADDALPKPLDLDDLTLAIHRQAQHQTQARAA